MQIHVLQKLLNRVNKLTEINQPQYIGFGLFMLANIPFYGYFDSSSISTENSVILTIRIIAIFVSLCLTLKNYWPKIIRHYLPLFWYFSLLYYLVFYAIFNLLTSYFSLVSLMNTMLCLFLLLLLVDWFSFIILTTLGVLMGFFCYYLFIFNSQFFSFNQFHAGIGFAIKYPYVIISYFWILIVAGLFSRNISRGRKITIMHKQMLAMQTIAASIAHEIRTPLLTIKTGLHGILNYLQSPKKLLLEKPHKNSNQSLLKAISYAQIADNEVISTNTIVDMILHKLNTNLKKHEFAILPITACIEEAINRYPFQSNTRRALINFDSENKFCFYGAKQLIIHVIFNLIKNALVSIQKAEKGEINIWLESNKKTNKLHFKDTGAGISPDVLPHIFNPFYSQSKAGSGVGLNFCKSVVESIGGDISCQSKKNSYAWFIISFPKITGEINEK